MNLTFAAQLNKMITAGLGGAVEAPETGVAVGWRVEYTSIGPAPILTFEANSELPLKALSVNMEPIQEGSGDPSPENIRPISGRSTVNVWRESTYDTSAEPALTIQLGQTVYGGTVDVVSGEMVVDRKLIIPRTVIGASASPIANWIFSIGDAPSLSDNSGKIVSNYFAKGGLAPGNCYITNAGRYIVCAPTDNTLNTVELANAWLAEHDLQLCYELAEPITVQLTPEQLTTVLGTNNVWSDADEVSLTYGNIYYTEGY